MNKASVALVCAALMGIAGQAHAYSFMTTADGLPLKWKQSSVDGTFWLPISANFLNEGQISEDELRRSIAAGMGQWQEATEGAVGFEVHTGHEPWTYPASMERDGVNSVSFASQNPDAALFLDGRTAAYTQLHFEGDSGWIVEFDMVINDVQFGWTLDPSLATYNAGGARPTLHLGDVITHELGHALGLGHSGNSAASQFTWGWHDQAHVGCDDRAGASALYPRPQLNTVGPGEITGGVRSPAGAPLKGAQVTAVSVSRRSPFASAMTDEHGRYTIGGLEEGDYFLVLEPFLAGASALSSYYADIDPMVCDGEPFARSFGTLTDGRRLALVSVGAGLAVEHRTLQAVCTESGGALVPEPVADADPAFARDLLDVGADRFAVVDRAITDSVPRYHRLTGVEGGLVISAVGHSLFSRTAVNLRLLDDELRPVHLYSQMPMSADEESGAANYDSLLIAEVALGTYYLEVTANLLPEAISPRGDLYQDEEPFVMLLGTMTSEPTDLSALAAGELATCADLAGGGWYVEPPGGPSEVPGGFVGLGCHASHLGGLGEETTAMMVMISVLLRRRRRERAVETETAAGEAPRAQPAARVAEEAT